MPSELIKQLLESGVHFGHKTSRWNPKMKKYIFGQRSGIYIIDLEKTEECIQKAKEYLLEITSKGEFVLFVGTKKQAQEVIQQEATRAGMFYVTERWPGGMLTNFATIKKSIARLKEIEKMKEDGTFTKFTKKEMSLFDKELLKLKKNFLGIVPMERMPAAIIIVDTKKEETAVKEALKLNIPIVGLLDTNGDPTEVNYAIPGNDDATKAIKMVISCLADSVIEGRKKFLSYLSHQGVAAKQTNVANSDVVVATTVEEEVKIKEIEEIVEATTKDETKIVKKVHVGQSGLDKNKARKKV